MVRLYKIINTDLCYWETWNDKYDSAIIHWGKVGEEGQQRTVKSKLFNKFEKQIAKEIASKKSEGYKEFEDGKMSFLEIEYNINGFGTEKDIEKRHRLEEEMNSFLGWTGLGHCDGGSIGSGTMEIGCIVVDFELAKTAITKKLVNTEFSNFSRIFKLDNE